MISGEDSGEARRPLFRVAGAVPASAGSELGAAPGRAGALQRRRTGGETWAPGRGGSREPQPPPHPPSRDWGFRHDFSCPGRAAASLLSLLSRSARLLCLARSLPVSISVLRALARFAFGTAVLLLPRGRPPGPSCALRAHVGALDPLLSFASCPVPFWAARVPDCIRPRQARSCPAPPAARLAPLPSPPLSLSLSFSLIVCPAPFTGKSMKPHPFQIGFPLELWAGKVADFFKMPVQCCVNSVCVVSWGAFVFYLCFFVD